MSAWAIAIRDSFTRWHMKCISFEDREADDHASSRPTFSPSLRVLLLLSFFSLVKEIRKCKGEKKKKKVTRERRERLPHQHARVNKRGHEKPLPCTEDVISWGSPISRLLISMRQPDTAEHTSKTRWLLKVTWQSVSVDSRKAAPCFFFPATRGLWTNFTLLIEVPAGCEKMGCDRARPTTQRLRNTTRTTKRKNRFHPLSCQAQKCAELLSSSSQARANLQTPDD